MVLRGKPIAPALTEEPRLRRRLEGRANGADQLERAEGLLVRAELGQVHAHAVEEVPEGDLGLAPVPRQELGEQPACVLLRAAFRRLRGHVAGQLLGDERDASIGLPQLLGSVRRAGSRSRHVLPD